MPISSLESRCTAKSRRHSHPRRTLSTVLVLLSLTLVLGACSSDDKTTDTGTPTIRHPEDFIPAGSSGMVKDGTARIATDVATLQDIVNGGYEIYTNHNFQELAEQKYLGPVSGEQGSIKIWIFDQGTVEDASALHAELITFGLWEAWDEFGDEAHRSEGLRSYSILFRQGQYSIRLDIEPKTDDAKSLLAVFAEDIEQEIVRGS